MLLPVYKRNENIFVVDTDDSSIELIPYNNWRDYVLKKEFILKHGIFISRKSLFNGGDRIRFKIHDVSVQYFGSSPFFYYLGEGYYLLWNRLFHIDDNKKFQFNGYLFVNDKCIKLLPHYNEIEYAFQIYYEGGRVIGGSLDESLSEHYTEESHFTVEDFKRLKGIDKATLQSLVSFNTLKKIALL